MNIEQDPRFDNPIETLDDTYEIEQPIENQENNKIEFVTVYRAAPISAKEPCQGDCWGAGTPQAELFGEGKKCFEIELAYTELLSYQDDQSGGIDGVGYDLDHDWYSFPPNSILRWREHGSETWNIGLAWEKHQKTFEKRAKQKELQKKRDREKMIYDGTDYEEYLEKVGLRVID